MHRETAVSGLIDVRYAVTFLILCVSCMIMKVDASTLTTYRIRTDQESYYQKNDNKISPFWYEWNNRTVFDSTCPRFIRALSKNDGNVNVSIQSVTTLTDLYFLVNLKYDHKAPTYNSIDIPLDAFVISLGADSLTALQSQTSLDYSSIYISLVRDVKSVKYCEKFSGGASCSIGSYATMSAEVIDVDSMSKAVEIRLSMNQLKTAVVSPGVRRGIEFRYYSSIDDAEKDLLNVKVFNAVDTSTMSKRLLLGNLEFDQHFNDPDYKITSPVENSKLVAGGLYTITWGSNVTGGVLALDYSLNNGTSWNAITTATANDGSHPWEIPFTSSDKCLLRLKKEDQVVASSTRLSIVYPLPVLLTLPDTVTIPVFQFESVTNAISYRIVIDTTPGFLKPLVDDTIKNTIYNLKTELPNAAIYWKVASNLDYTCFSETDTFVKRPVLSTLYQKSSGKKIGIRMLDRNRIIYSTYRGGNVCIDLVSISGKVIKSLYSGYSEQGEYDVRFDIQQMNLSQGTYLLRIKTDEMVKSVPWLLIK